MSNLNPRICTTHIGLKELREITIYPLSVGMQAKTVELVTLLINRIADNSLEGLSDIELAEMFGGSIIENITKILEFVADPKDAVTVDEIDNTQMVEIISIIVKNNFGDSVKKLKAIWGETKGMFLSPKS